MVTLPDLWLPIVLAAALIHIGGFVMWMVLPHHRGDWKRLPDEDGVMAALRTSGAGAGQYTFPHVGSHDAMKDPAWQAKAAAGPTGFVILRLLDPARRSVRSAPPEPAARPGERTSRAARCHRAQPRSSGRSGPWPSRWGPRLPAGRGAGEGHRGSLSQSRHQGA